MLSRHALALLVALAGPWLLVGCGGATLTRSASSSVVTVTADEARCELDRTQLESGATTFAITNKGTQVTEVYVYAPADGAYSRVVAEVENIGPGLSRDLTAELGPGTYEVACKPGQTGSGIRTRVTVSGTASPTAEAATGYDRELELASDGVSLTGDFTGARPGERIELKLTNTSDRALILEVKDPSGAVAGESGPIAPGATGELIVELKTGGAWTVIAESDGHDDVTATLSVS